MKITSIFRHLAARIGATFSGHTQRHADALLADLQAHRRPDVKPVPMPVHLARLGPLPVRPEPDDDEYDPDDDELRRAIRLAHRKGVKRRTLHAELREYFGRYSGRFCAEVGTHTMRQYQRRYGG